MIRAWRHDDQDTPLRRSVVQRSQAGAANHRRRALPPRKRLPEQVRREYVAFLTDLARMMRAEVEAELVPALPALVAEAGLAVRADSWPRRIAELMRATRLSLDSRLRSIEPVIRRFALFVKEHGDEEAARAVRAVLGIRPTFGEAAVSDMIDSFVAENVSLIVTIRDDLLKDVETVVQRGIREGKRAEVLRKDVEARFGVTERRAQLIARDQIGKLDGQITRERHLELGITRFLWQTAEDERVRDEHVERNQKVYSYASPPDGEIPGTAINCRCVAIPVFDDLAQEAQA